MSPLQPDEPLVIVRVDSWRLALPLRCVETVLSAALPVAVPAQDGEAAVAVRLHDALLPLVFARALLGAQEVVLRVEDKMVLVRGERGRMFLWVSAVEDLVPYVPISAPALSTPLLSSWVSAFSASDVGLAVLDVPKLEAAMSGVST